ncbi:MAG: hypothetical protein HYU73_15365 [Betaproteobacteria bacterium]|nr:hypothetical protein [Betaproteobacteria bacterium]MBI3057477.1 hypothetical protein [Betaproteobacteria bacterium]
MIRHGALLACKARKPDCPACPINDWCEYSHQSKDEAFPAFLDVGDQLRLSASDTLVIFVSRGRRIGVRGTQAFRYILICSMAPNTLAL